MHMLREANLCLVLFAAALILKAGGAEPTKIPAKPTANRLAKESSPYLLLHAHNPVDWYPWGEEALAKAQREKKPIFLSIGYSSCYWCHVMERESFMDAEIAAVLNKHFVCIKVDREERPDLDEIYMQALSVYLQLAGSAQGGGWPLSMFLTPDAKPLMGGTYFPPRDKDDRLGFLSIAQRVHEAWSKEPEKWQKVGDQIADIVRDSLAQRPAVIAKKLDDTLVDQTQTALAEQFDAQYGGFGFTEKNPKRPKFPEPPNLSFLLSRIERSGDEQAKKMLFTTLDRVAAGGIRDHVGGGFHRYSTDRFWRVPHFEKMLYDNAQLAGAYARAYAIDPRTEYAAVVDEIVVWLAREMTSPEGAFYTALDAETDAKEGLYYVWTRDDVKKLLPGQQYALVADVYGLAGEPNFEEQYILQLSRPFAEIAAQRKQPVGELIEQSRAALDKLLIARNKRKRPLTDTKILASTNGLMIQGLATAGRLLKRRDYIERAEKAANFILTRLVDKDARLSRSYSGGQAKLTAFLDDYAFTIAGLIALHRATDDKRWLDEADRLMQAQIKRYWDDRHGGFYFTPDDHEDLIARSKAPTDGVAPSGNTASAENLVYLAVSLDKPDYLDRARQTITSATPMLDQSPVAAPQLVAVVPELLKAEASSSKAAAKPAE
jgi:uncharacterized protein